MLAPDPTNLTTSWDFAPVFDLLRSPTWGGTSHHAKSTVPVSPNDWSKHESGHGVDKPTPKLTPQRSYPKLGDFGSLWEILGRDQSSTNGTDSGNAAPAEHSSDRTHVEQRPQIQSAAVHDHLEIQASRTPISPPNTSKPTITRDTVSRHSLHSAPRPPAVTILKRAVDSKSSPADDTSSLARIPLNPAANTSDSLTAPRVKSKTKKGRGIKGRASDPKAQPISSESSAEAESDSNANVFDRPLSKKSGVLAFLPSQVEAPNAWGQLDDTPPSSYDDTEPAFRPEIVQHISNGSGPIRVQSVLYNSATERRVFLMTKLLKDFPEYAQLVSSMGNPSTTPNKGVESRPVHVFVDMSNIMVGFHDSVKVSRNIPVTTRIRRVHMSFANLALILERGRPVAKRVLVGSDRLPSIDEAESIGYEANILDRVHKVKHTSRPYKSRKPGSQWASGKPETANAGGERWVEQGVDEILHLKILESLIDTVEPATIVLATGDAAEAEYSGGFMCQVERVLQRGWAVELVSFSQVTSNAYRRKDFRSKWGKQFRLIELDAYVEELFE